MSEIKVGEYVRLKNGEIFKIDENTTNYYNSNKDYITNEITKHSESIIDLIELGDFVNRSEVVGVKDNFYGVKCVYVDTQIYHDQRLTEDEIVSVITHEQLEEMEYKL